MLKLLRRWLGWDADDSFDLGGIQTRPGAASATRELFSGKQKPKPPQARPTSRPTTAPRERKPEAAPRAGHPRLSLDKAAEERFDPYNTGAFNRSASWERISRSGR